MTDPIKAAIAILALMLVLAFGAWLVAGRTGLFATLTRQTAPQRTATPDPASRPAIPHLDAAGTAGAKVATFALG